MKKFRIGESGWFSKWPEWVEKLPIESVRVFRMCFLKKFKISEFDRELLVLDVSAEVDRKVGSFMNDIRVEPKFVSRTKPRTPLRTKTLGTQIVARTLTFVDGGAREHAVRMRIGAPVRFGTDAWQVPFSVSGFGDRSVNSIIGIDGLQAFALTRKYLEAVLRHDASSRGGRIFWLEDGDPNAALLESTPPP